MSPRYDRRQARDLAAQAERNASQAQFERAIDILSRPGAALRKYRNEPILVHGVRFDSKLEARRYLQLQNLWRVGEVRWFIRQVPFELAPRTSYRADFLVALPRDPWIQVEDCKGHLTATSRVKIAMVEKLYGLKIRILTRDDLRGVNLP